MSRFLHTPVGGGGGTDERSTGTYLITNKNISQKMNAPSTPRTTRTIRTPARPQRPVRTERAQNLHMSRVNTIRPRALFVENN